MTVKKGGIIGLGAVCFVVVFVVIVLAFGGSSVDLSAPIANVSGEKLVDRHGNEFGTEKYILLPIIQEETWLMDTRPASQYTFDNYKGDPLYDSECQRLYDALQNQGRENKKLMEEQNTDIAPLDIGHWYAFDKLCDDAEVDMTP